MSTGSEGRSVGNECKDDEADDEHDDEEDGDGDGDVDDNEDRACEAENNHDDKREWECSNWDGDSNGGDTPELCSSLVGKVKFQPAQ
jgi:hypothetical protein